MRAGLEMRVKQKVWQSAAIIASNLSELELTLGEVAEAVASAEASVNYADLSGDAVWLKLSRTTHADALHQAGRRSDAAVRFREAEILHAEANSAYPLLPSPANFYYCEILLGVVERDGWRVSIDGGSLMPTMLRDRHNGSLRDIAICKTVEERVAKTLQWSGVAFQATLLSTALDHLSLGRAEFYKAIQESSHSDFRVPRSELDVAVVGLRRAGQKQYLTLGLLTRAWLRSFTNAHTGPDSAQSDLDEAWDISERGSMPLFIADIRLYRARLFYAVKPYPWESPHKDLAEARKLIEKCGYWRRKEELEDAEKAAQSWT
jgi:hypothetical protein